MTSDRPLPVLVTHGGKFHCDEVFAYVTLRLALALREPGADHTLVRTRDPKAIAAADLVWDVGGVHDAAARRFDHHQRGAPTREDGTPLSSAGLIWPVHGRQAVAALLRPAGAERFAEQVAADIDATVVRRVDEIDNGVAPSGDTLGLASLVGDCNPGWDAAADGDADQDGDRAFLEAAALVEGVLRRRVEAMRARLAAEAAVVAAHAASADPRILEMERGMPWKGAVFAHGLAVLYAVSPASNGNWMVDAMPPEPGSFAQRLPLPEGWAGLQGADLAVASGVADAVFVHLRRFVGAARSRAGAVALAQRAIALGEGGQAARPDALPSDPVQGEALHSLA